MRSSASAGASGPPANQSSNPKSGSPPNPKIAGWSPLRSARRAPTPADRSRARTSEHAAANTEVPDPPFGDHNARSTSGPSSSDTRTRVTDRRKCAKEERGTYDATTTGVKMFFSRTRGHTDTGPTRDRARHEGGPGIVRSVWLRQASRTFLATAMPIAAMMRSRSSFFMASPLNGRRSKRRRRGTEEQRPAESARRDPRRTGARRRADPARRCRPTGDAACSSPALRSGESAHG
jgi:hypothetical protein